MVDIFEDLSKGLLTLTGPQSIAFSEAIFGRIAGSEVVAAIQKEGIPNIRRMREEILKAAGISRFLAQIMRKEVRGQILALKSAIESVLISTFKKSEIQISKVVKELTRLVRKYEDVISTKLSNFLNFIVKNFKTIALWAKRVGIALAVFIPFIVVLRSFVLVMTALNLVLDANPITLMVIGVIALAAGLVALAVWIKRTTSDFLEQHSTINKVVTSIGFLIDLADGVPQAWAKIPVFFKSMWQKILDDFNDFKLEILGGFGKINEVGGAFGLRRPGQIGGLNSSSLSARALEASIQPSQPEVASPRQVVVSPNQASGGGVTETRTVNTSEVTIRDETGLAELTKGIFGNGVTLQQTGAF